MEKQVLWRGIREQAEAQTVFVIWATLINMACMAALRIMNCRESQSSSKVYLLSSMSVCRYKQSKLERLNGIMSVCLSAGILVCHCFCLCDVLCYVFQYIIFVNIVFHETSKRVMPRSRPSFSEFYLYDYVVIYFFILWYIISNCLCTCYSKILEYFFYLHRVYTFSAHAYSLHTLIFCIYLFSAYI